MKRAAAALVATVAGVAWLVTFRVTPHERAVARATPEAAPPSPPAAPAPAVTPSPTPTPRAADGGFTGRAVPTIYGDIQVRATVRGGRLTDVQAVQLPFDRARSAEISQAAEPMLREEAIQAQSAQIDALSGATYTSIAYAQSLEDALRQDHLG